MKVPPGRGVVAVSGGADSVALLRKVHGAGVPVVAAHLNHGLRGTESDADEAFVAELAEALGIPFRSKRADAFTGNLEAAAREARYAFLGDVATECGAAWVATGHTADDQAETILFHLMRGTGLGGLRGIAAERELRPGVTLVRPMLRTSRSEVVAYLAEVGQDHRHDASNDDRRFTRNRIRHELLPLMRTFNPDVAGALGQFAVQANEWHADHEAAALALLGAVELSSIDGTIFIDRKKLRGVPRHRVREMLRALWMREGWPVSEMGFADWERAADVVAAVVRGVDLPGVRMSRSRGVVSLRGV